MIIMEDLDRKLQDLENLVERSKIATKIQYRLMFGVDAHKRKYLINSIRQAIKLVMDSGKRTMMYNRLRENEVLVHSCYDSWHRGGKVREGYIVCTIPSRERELDRFSPLGKLSPLSREIMRKYDSNLTRIVYLDEFKERCEILIRAIEFLVLNDLFDIPPFEILHQINGRHGELLSKLKIDPMESRIYREGKVKIIKIIENE